MSDGTIDREASVSAFLSYDYAPMDLWQRCIGVPNQFGGAFFFAAPADHGFLPPYNFGEAVFIIGVPHHGRPRPAAEPADADRSRPRWRDSVSDQIADLCALKPNWDGRGGLKPLVRPLRVAELVLQAVMADDSPAPWVVPTSERGIDLEWKFNGGGSIIISIPPDKDVEVVVEDPDRNIDVDGNLNDLTLAREVLQGRSAGGG